MTFLDVLLPEFIKVDIEADDKDGAFKELVALFCKTDNSNSYDEILDAILTREAKMSTGIYKGIAIPHGKTDAVKTLRIVLGISHKGVNYDALDGEPVYLLFMIISPPDDPENHLRLLKHLAQLIETPNFQLELQAQKDSQSVYNVICKFEQMLLSGSA